MTGETTFLREGSRGSLFRLLAIGLTFTTSPLLAAGGTDGAAFLKIPVGAGPAAMGGAYTSLAANAYAPVWNPAGLANIPRAEIAGQHLSYLESLNYEFASVAVPLKNKHHGLGISAQYLTSGDITETDNGGATIGNYNAHFAAYSLAYGYRFGDRLSLGVAGKVIEEKIADVSASAFGADAGLLYKASERLSLGLAVANIGSKLKFLSASDPLPLEVRFGGALRPMPRILLSAEAVYRKEESLAGGHFGVEWTPIELMSLRAGYKTDTLKELSAVAGVTAGIGLHVFGQEFAYAFVPYGDLGTTQYFSLMIRFGAEQERRRNLIQYQSIKRHRTAHQRMPATLRHTEAADQPEYDQLMQILSDNDRELVTRTAPDRQAGEAQ